MSSYQETFEADASFYLSDTGNEADHPQQVKFIEDQLKELEQRVKHIDTTIKEKNDFIEYSERLRIYLQHRIEPVSSSYNIFFRDSNSLQSPFYLDQGQTLHEFEITEEDELFLQDLPFPWDRIKCIENRINSADQDINCLENQKQYCLNQSNQLKLNRSRVLQTCKAKFQVNVKKFR